MGAKKGAKTPAERAQDRAATACLREVQARRVCREWTLDGIDACKNMSALGLSLLLAVALSCWYGARVRVARGRDGAAMVALQLGDRWRLVDPTRTLLNAFGVAETTRVVHGPAATLNAGAVVEVRIGARWHVGVLRSINEGCMVVHVAHNHERKVLSVQSHAVRRVGSDTSDVDAIVCPLLNARKRKA